MLPITTLGIVQHRHATMMFLTSPELTAPIAAWEAWRDYLRTLPQRDASVVFALQRAEGVLQRRAAHAALSPSSEPTP